MTTMLAFLHVLAQPGAVEAAEAAEGPSTWGPVAIGLTVFVLIILLILFLVLFQFIGLYVRALVSGAHVSLLDLVGMKLRKVNAAAIVNSRIQAIRAGLDVSTPEM